MDLHNVIVGVLEKAGQPVSVRNIAQIIEENDLWRRPKDGKHPKQEQVSARVNNYPHLFLRENGVVRLKEKQESEKRLLRLTWNIKGWEMPCGHDWNKKNQGKSDIAFENQFGFGGEEWLFNSRYQKDGFQYGFIRGVQNLADSVEIVNKAYLFTISPRTSRRYLVGIISNLEIIVGYEPEEKIAKKLYDEHLLEMKNELSAVKCDPKGLDYGFVASVKFKVSGNELFEKPIPIPGLSGRKYNRFQPYIVNAELEKIITGHLPQKFFVFSDGIAKNSAAFDKELTGSTKTVVRTHSDITNSLEKFLSPEFTKNKKNISIEKTRFGDNIADVVLKHSETEYSIIEIKTSINIRKNVREALGQLIDYAYWYPEITIRNLIIVSPASLEKDSLNYFERIKKSLKLNLEYWQYQSHSQMNEPLFVKIIF